MQISVAASKIRPSEAELLFEQTRQLWSNVSRFPPYDIELRHDQCEPSDGTDGSHRLADTKSCNRTTPDLVIELEPSKDGYDGSFTWQTFPSKIKISHTPGSSSDDPLALASSMASCVQSIFNEEQASVASSFAARPASAGNAEAFLNTFHPDVSSSIIRRQTRAFRYAPTYHLTFSLFTPGPAPSSWAIESALNTHLKPWLSALEATSNFSITTQVQLFSSFSESIQPIAHGSGNGTYLRYDDLSAFVNAAEWPVSPSIGSGPTMNFVLYIPAVTQAPLTLEGTSETSWLIPQWGGISILNPPLETNPETGRLTNPTHLSQDMLAGPFETFTSQLLSLLGVPSLLLGGKPLPLHVRLQSHKRLSTISVYFRASSTLGSLARLSQSLGSIPIPKKVAKLVDDTMEHLEMSCQNLKMSKWDGALSHAREAYANSEKAFFEKSMVGQVYFPDEHKVAVYLPLLGPIGVPLVVALVREVKQLIKALRASKK